MPNALSGELSMETEIPPTFSRIGAAGTKNYSVTEAAMAGWALGFIPSVLRMTAISRLTSDS
jgi:hypothetical protein